MNKIQQKFIVQWALIIIILSPIFIFSENISDNWEVIKFPSLIVILILVALVKNKKNFADGRNLHEYSQDHPWVTVYISMVALTALTVSIFIIAKGIKIENIESFTLGSFAILIVPPVIGMQVERFKELGEKSNK